MIKQLMKHTAHPDHEEHGKKMEQFEAEYGEDWENTVIEYSSDFVNLPKYVIEAAYRRNILPVLRWLGNTSSRKG